MRSMDETANSPRIEVQDIDHLGIVAGIIDETGLVEEIDRRVGTHPQEHVTCAQAVKAMLLNGLGFLSALFTSSRSSFPARPPST